MYLPRLHPIFWSVCCVFLFPFFSKFVVDISVEGGDATSISELSTWTSASESFAVTVAPGGVLPAMRRVAFTLQSGISLSGEYLVQNREMVFFPDVGFFAPCYKFINNTDGIDRLGLLLGLEQTVGPDVTMAAGSVFAGVATTAITFRYNSSGSLIKFTPTRNCSDLSVTDIYALDQPRTAHSPAITFKHGGWHHMCLMNARLQRWTLYESLRLAINGPYAINVSTSIEAGKLCTPLFAIENVHELVPLVFDLAPRLARHVCGRFNGCSIARAHIQMCWDGSSSYIMSAFFSFVFRTRSGHSLHRHSRLGWRNRGQNSVHAGRSVR